MGRSQSLDGIFAEDKYPVRLTPKRHLREVDLSHGTEVKVIDADNGSLVGNIAALSGNDRFALLPALGRAVSSSALRRTAPAHLDTSPSR